ncbi:hypothetical protein VNO80_01215 [Phaseolus coccineus]|uniref:Uncharacterized protein n=1 Tax=Phaseolus coccineus TaxID=3886 RepID=A0AAN9NZN8_PHACN
MRPLSTHCLSRLPISIESEIQAWIDRETLHTLYASLRNLNDALLIAGNRACFSVDGLCALGGGAMLTDQVLELDCVFEIGYFRRKEAVETMVKEMLVKSGTEVGTVKTKRKEEKKI